MKRSLLLIVLLLATILLATTTVVHGQEHSWLQRINPFRLIPDRGVERVSPRDRSTDERLTPPPARGLHAPWKDATASRTRPSPHQAQERRQWGAQAERNLQTPAVPQPARHGPRAFEEHGFSANHRTPPEPAMQGGPFGQRTAAGNPPTAQELRMHLFDRGVDPAIVDRRIEHLVSRRGTARERVAEPRPEQAARLDQIRAEMRARDLDVSRDGMPSPRGRRLPSRQQRGGASVELNTLSGGETAIEERVARGVRANGVRESVSARLGSPPERPNASPAAARLGRGRSRRQ